MRTIQLFVCILILSAAAFAGDYAHFHFIGFSADGNYLAFEEYGFNDELDDDSAYSNIYIVNVRENRWAIKPFLTHGGSISSYSNGKYNQDEVETETRDRCRRKAAKQLKRFKIVDGNPGLQTAAHLMNEYDTDYEEVAPTAEELAKRKAQDEKDEAEIMENTGKWANANVANSNSNTSSNSNSNTSSNSNSDSDSFQSEEVKSDPLDVYKIFLPQQVSFTKRGNALYRDGFYQLKIKPVPVTQTNCDNYERNMFSFELSLTNESKETRILQKSGRVPSNRGCVDGYGIQEVFIYRNYVAAFLGVFTRGWEGENLRLIAVTGKLDN